MSHGEEKAEEEGPMHSQLRHGDLNFAHKHEFLDTHAFYIIGLKCTIFLKVTNNYKKHQFFCLFLFQKDSTDQTETIQILRD